MGNGPGKPRIHDPNRTLITVEEVLALLTRIEQHRAQLDADAELLRDWLNGSPQLARAWREFTQAGGISAAEFDQFLHGKFKPRPSGQPHKHLRVLT